MKFDYTIKNFRAFDAKGATFTISPITILTGTNSSGKSSMVKSMRLLDKYLSKMKVLADRNKCRPVAIPLEFFDKEGQLGNYWSALNDKAGKKDCMSFEYSIYSELLEQKCTVKFLFQARENSINGVLRAIEISSEKKDFDCRFMTDWDLEKKEDFNIEEAISCASINRTGIFRAFLDYIALWYPEYILNQDIDSFNNKREKYLQGISAIQKMNGFLFRKEDVSQEMAFYMLQNRSLAYLPVLAVLGKEEKSDENPVIPFLDEDDSLYSSYVAVKEDFLRSEHKTLLGYVKAKEEQYLKTKPRELLNGIALAPDFFSHIGENADIYRPEFDTDIANVSYLRVINVLSRLSELHFAPEVNHLAFSEQVRRNNRVLSIDSTPANHVRSLDLFDRFNEAVFRELLIPFFVGNITYVSSSRAIVRRIYSLNDASNPLEEQLAHFLSLEKGEENSDAMRFINSWMKKFGIGEELILKEAEGGAGIVPLLRKRVEDTPRSLADEGYGITQLLSILLNIGIGIHDYNRTNEKFYSLSGTYFPTIIIVEEPEIHLHPRMQSLLADMFIEASRLYNINFIIETHSEYLVRSVQYHIAIHRNPSKGIPSEDASIYYISCEDEGSDTKRIEILPDGSLNSSFGSGFFDESKRQLLERLKLRAHNG